MLANNFDFETMMSIQRSWEIARQKVACVENVGPTILHILLERSEEFKKSFGFQEGRPIQVTNPRAQASLLVQGSFLTQLLDDAIEFTTGPDEEMLLVFLERTVDDLQERGLVAEDLNDVGKAVRIFLRQVVGSDYTQKTNTAWRSLFKYLAEELEEAEMRKEFRHLAYVKTRRVRFLPYPPQPYRF